MKQHFWLNMMKIAGLRETIFLMLVCIKNENFYAVVEHYSYG